MLHFRLVLIAILVACSRDPVDEHPISLPPEATSLKQVQNGTLESGVERWRVDTIPSLRLGNVDGDECMRFNAISSFAELPSGHVIVPESSIRIIDSTAKCVASLGGEGDGPGEFHGAIQVAAGGGDTVFAMASARNRDLNIYSVSVGFLTKTSVDRGSLSSFGGPSQSAVTASLIGDGKTLLRAAAPYFNASGSSGAIRARDSAAFLVLNREFRLARSLGSWGAANRIKWDFRRRDGTNLSLYKRAYQVSDAYSDTDPFGRRTCVGDSSQPAIACFDGDASEGLTIRWQAPWLRVSAEESRKYLADPGPGGPAAQELNRDEYNAFVARIERPLYQPFFTAIAVDAELNVWVRPRAVSSDSGQVAWAVFSREGDLRAIATIPAKVRAMRIYADHILTTERDSLGVYYLVKLPIRK